MNNQLTGVGRGGERVGVTANLLMSDRVGARYSVSALQSTVLVSLYKPAPPDMESTNTT